MKSTRALDAFTDIFAVDYGGISEPPTPIEIFEMVVWASSRGMSVKELAMEICDIRMVTFLDSYRASFDKKNLVASYYDSCFAVKSRFEPNYIEGHKLAVRGGDYLFPEIIYTQYDLLRKANITGDNLFYLTMMLSFEYVLGYSSCVITSEIRKIAETTGVTLDDGVARLKELYYRSSNPKEQNLSKKIGAIEKTAKFDPVLGLEPNPESARETDLAMDTTAKAVFHSGDYKVSHITSKKMKKKIFISHASVDKEIILPLIDLLENIGIRHNEVFFSSHAAYGVEIGKNIFEELKTVLDSDIMALFILSENFYNSPVCLCEMGAVWIKSNMQVPILIPPFDFVGIKGVFPHSLGFKINDKEQLNNFKLKLERTFDLQPVHPSRWEEKREEYLNKINRLLSKQTLNESSTMERNEYSGFGIQEIDENPDLKMLVAHYLDKGYSAMSFDNIQKYVNPEFTEDYLMKMIKRHSLIIRRGKVRSGDFGVFLISPEQFYN